MPETLVVTDEAVVQTQLEFKAAQRRLLVAIVLTRSGSIEASPLARIISRLRAVPYSSVLRKLVQGSGIIMRDASREEAAEVGAELTRQGLRYILIPTRELLQSTRVTEIKDVKVSEVSLTFITRENEAFAAPWGELFIVTCGCVKRDQSVTRYRRAEFPLHSLAQEEEAPAKRLVMTLSLSLGAVSVQLECNIPGEPPAEEQQYLPKHPFEKIGRVIYQMHTKQAQNKGMRILSLSGIKGAWKGLIFPSADQLREYNMWLAALRKYQVNVVGTKRSKFSILALNQPKFIIEEEMLTAAQLLRIARAEREKAVLLPAPTIAPSPVPDKGGILVERSTLIKVSTIVAIILFVLWILMMILR